MSLNRRTIVTTHGSPLFGRRQREDLLERLSKQKEGSHVE
jgi:hypothetical protein